jgi:hypothetical protein
MRAEFPARRIASESRPVETKSPDCGYDFSIYGDLLQERAMEGRVGDPIGPGPDQAVGSLQGVASSASLAGAVEHLVTDEVAALGKLRPFPATTV